MRILWGHGIRFKRDREIDYLTLSFSSSVIILGCTFFKVLSCFHYSFNSTLFFLLFGIVVLYLYDPGNSSVCL